MKAKISLLNDISPKLSEAIVPSGNCLFTGISEAFNAWSTTRFQGLEQRLNHITTELVQLIREEFEEEEDIESKYEGDEDEEETLRCLE